MFSVKYCTVLLCICSVQMSCCWQFFQPLNSLRTQDEDTETITEFIYGNCNKRNKTILFDHVLLTPEDIKKKAITRGWLNIHRVPTCVKVRGTYYEEDMFRSTAYKFQMCTPVITFIYNQDRYRYFYYEWYLPDEDLSGVYWDLYFYAPQKKEWGS